MQGSPTEDGKVNTRYCSFRVLTSQIVLDSVEEIVEGLDDGLKLGNRRTQPLHRRDEFLKFTPVVGRYRYIRRCKF